MYQGRGLNPRSAEYEAGCALTAANRRLAALPLILILMHMIYK
jgi:hypothetical protein